jgi:hypothetical protein
MVFEPNENLYTPAEFADNAEQTLHFLRLLTSRKSWVFTHHYPLLPAEFAEKEEK